MVGPHKEAHMSDLLIFALLWVVPVIVGTVAAWPRASESYRRTLD